MLLDIQFMNSKKTYPVVTEESIMLARKARKEKHEKGEVLATCPKCHHRIEVDELYHNGILVRVSVWCKCGYVRDGEIYF